MCFHVQFSYKNIQYFSFIVFVKFDNIDLQVCIEHRNFHFFFCKLNGVCDVLNKATLNLPPPSLTSSPFTLKFLHN